MSESWDALMKWKKATDLRLAALENPNAYPAAARKRDDQLADSIDKAALWTPTIFVGAVAATRATVVYRASGAEVLTAAFAQNGDSLAYDGTNYWTFALMVRCAAVTPFAADTDGTTVGSLTTETVSLVAQTSFSLYTSVAGLAMAAGDVLVLGMTKTGAPADLVDVTFWPTVQRITR